MATALPAKPTASERSLAQRRRIVALSAAGHGAGRIAAERGCSRRTLYRWRRRRRQAGAAGLA